MNKIKQIISRLQQSFVSSRFFIVFYTSENLNGGYNVGNMTFTSEGFLNLKKTIEQIKEINKNFGKVVITGIKEISKGDFNEWTER